MLTDLRERMATRPFVPFVIHTASGADLRVPTVDHIAVSPTGSRVVVFTDDDRTVLVSPLLIGHITVDSATAPSAAA